MFGAVYGTLGVYLPNKFVEDVPGMERLLSDNGYTDITLISTNDFHLFNDAAEFSATSRTGEKMNVIITFRRGVYSIKY